MQYRKLAILVLSLCAASVAVFAKPARRVPVLFYQPDGSSFMATLVGDEFQHLLLTTGGHAVTRDADGWYSYQLFNEDGSRYSSGVHIGDVSAAAGMSVSRTVPYETIAGIANAKRMNAPKEDRNLMQRLAERYDVGPGTRAAAVEKHGIVILAAFPDVPFQYKKSDFEKMLSTAGYSFNGATGCAKEYFNDQFGGAYNFTFDVSDIVTLPNKRSYYGANDANDNDKAPELMVIDACRLASSKIDFSLYDDDKDGEVDNVFVFFAGGDEAEYAGEECIWSHAWYIVDGAGYDGKDYNGDGKPDKEKIVFNGKVVNRYACTSELTATSWTGSGNNTVAKTFTMAGIGTFCHEYSHTFGLPDLYDTDYDKNGSSDGVWGSTSLMDSGSYNNGGNTPPYYNAIEREILKISDPVDLKSGSYTITPINTDGIYYRVQSKNDGEYYLLECRANTGWDKYIGGKGLLVYHIDKSSNKLTLQVDGKNATKSARDLWDDFNLVNAQRTHPCADILEANPSANGKYETRKKSGSPSCVDIFYPYSSYKSISPETSQKFQFWDGSVSDVVVNNIAISGSNVTMSVLGDGSVEVPPTPIKVEYDRFHDAAIVSFESSRSFSGEASVSYGVSGQSKTSLKVQPYEDGRYAVLVEGLKPKTSYEFVLSFYLGDIEGQQTAVKFLTSSVPEDGYPYIVIRAAQKNADGSLKAGSKLPLRIGGITDYDGVTWYYQGRRVSVGRDCYFTPTVSGELKAEISYSDGSHDYIIRNIAVN